MKLVAHIRASIRKTKLGYASTLHVTETATRQAYSFKVDILRSTPKDAIYDAMQEAQDLAQRNGMAFKPTYANAGDVYQPAAE